MNVLKFCTYLRYDAIHSKRFYKENELDVICNFTATYCAHSLNITRDTVPLIVMIHQSPFSDITRDTVPLLVITHRRVILIVTLSL